VVKNTAELIKRDTKKSVTKFNFNKSFRNGVLFLNACAQRKIHIWHLKVDKTNATITEEIKVRYSSRVGVWFLCFN